MATLKGTTYERVTNLFVNGLYDEGLDLLEKHRRELARPVVAECLGNLCFYKRELQRAVDHYEEAMNADPNYDVARYHYLIGIQDERQGDLEAAFDRYQAAIEIEPTFVDSYIELGGLLTKVDDLEGALRCYTDSLALDENDLRVYANRMNVLKALAGRDSSQYGEELNHAVAAYAEAKTRLPAIPDSTVW